MSTTPTANYGFSKITAGTEKDIWGPIQSTTLDAIDTQIKNRQNEAAAKMPLAGGTFTGKVTYPAGGSGAAPLNIPQGIAPSAPVNGDFWSTSAAFFGRINGATVQLSVVGHTHAQADVTNLVSDLALKAPLASPALTGIPTAPTAAGGTNTTQLATTAFVSSAVAAAGSGAPINSPAFTGNPTAPTPTAGDNDTSIATTAFVQTALAGLTIADNAVTNAKLADMAANTIKGAVAAGDPADLTAAQVVGIVSIGGGYSRQTGNYTLVIGDVGKVVEMNVASANNLTIPPNSSVAFALNTEVHGSQYGAGQTTIVAGAGVTLRAAGGKLKSTAQYSAWTMKKVGTDEWYVWGDLTT